MSHKRATMDQPVKIPFNVTETGANTFTQVEVNLPTSALSGLVLDLDEIELSITQPTMAANTLGQIDIQVTQSTQTAILGLDNDNLIAFLRREATNNSGNAGFYTWYHDQNLGILSRDRPNYIPLRDVFIAIQGTAQSAAKNVTGNLIGRLVKVSQEQLTSLLLDAAM